MGKSAPKAAVSALLLLAASCTPAVTLRGGPSQIPVHDVGLFPMSLLHGGWVVVDGQVGREHGAFVLDSGAFTSIIDLKLVTRAGGAPLLCHDPGGIIGRICRAWLPALAFGPYFRSAAFGVAADISRSEVGAFGVSGIIGADVLSQFSVVLDYPRSQWALFPPESFTPPLGVRGIPLHSTQEGLVTIPVMVMGERQQFLLDTGAITSAIALEPKGEALSTFNRPGVLELPNGFRTGDGSQSTIAATHGNLCVGEVCWEHAPVTVVKPGSLSGRVSAFQGVLGSAFLRHFRVSIDYSRHLLYLEQQVPFEPNAGEWTLGLVALPKEGQLEVQSVAPGGPAALAGIKIGDTIRKVSGLSTKGRSDVLSTYLVSRTGAPVSIQVERAGTIRNLSPVPVAVP